MIQQQRAVEKSHPCRADERPAPLHRDGSVDHRRWNVNVSSSLLDLFMNIRRKQGTASPVYSTGYFTEWRVKIVTEAWQQGSCDVKILAVRYEL